MPVDLVLLSDAPITPDVRMRAALSLFEDGLWFDVDGVTHFVDYDPEHVLRIYPSKPVLHRADAASTAAGAPESFGLWTEMTVPYRSAAKGRGLANAIAELVSGVVKERV